MKNLKYTSLLLVLVAMVAFSSCKKDEGTGGVDVYMTDAPGDYKEVNVEVVAVEIHHDNDWVSLPTKAGIYDLLTLRDSVTELIASGINLHEGKVSQLRLILGTNNTVVVDSVGTFPLTIPSSQNTGIKINIDQSIPVDRTLTITLDFDAEASINKTGEGEYKLSPVIKVKDVIVK